jgi:hypothetical protein
VTKEVIAAAAQGLDTGLDLVKGKWADTSGALSERLRVQFAEEKGEFLIIWRIG